MQFHWFRFKIGPRRMRSIFNWCRSEVVRYILTAFHIKIYRSQSATKWQYIGANGPTDAIVSNPNMISWVLELFVHNQVLDLVSHKPGYIISLPSRQKWQVMSFSNSGDYLQTWNLNSSQWRVGSKLAFRNDITSTPIMWTNFVNWIIYGK